MRSLNMQSLTHDIKLCKPGVVIYGIGDEAHQHSPSDHNEDDTPGSNPEETDADSKPEHRAIDVMTGPNFENWDADTLVVALVNDPVSQARLKYIIWWERIWSANSGWQERPYSGSNKHRDHVHISGRAADDDNTAPWSAVLSAFSNQPAPPAPAPVPPPPPVLDHPVLQRGSTGDYVRRLQQFLRNVFPAYKDYVPYLRGTVIWVDGDFGPQTYAWVKEFQRRVGIVQDGIVGPITVGKLRKYGYKY